MGISNRAWAVKSKLLLEGQRGTRNQIGLANFRKILYGCVPSVRMNPPILPADTLVVAEI